MRKLSAIGITVLFFLSLFMFIPSVSAVPYISWTCPANGTNISNPQLDVFTYIGSTTGCRINASIWTNSTSGWDWNGNGTVDFDDADYLTAHYLETGSPGWLACDCNYGAPWYGDGVINYLDASSFMGAPFGHVEGPWRQVASTDTNWFGSNYSAHEGWMWLLADSNDDGHWNAADASYYASHYNHSYPGNVLANHSFSFYRDILNTTYSDPTTAFWGWHDPGIYYWSINVSDSCTGGWTNSTIIYYYAAPIEGASIVINGGSSSTYDKNVVLTLSCVNATQMQFKNEASNWSAWEAYAVNKNWVLSNGSGSKTVHVKYKDVSGASTMEAYDIITLFDYTDYDTWYDTQWFSKKKVMFSFPLAQPEDYCILVNISRGGTDNLTLDIPCIAVNTSNMGELRFTVDYRNTTDATFYTAELPYWHELIHYADGSEVIGSDLRDPSNDVNITWMWTWLRFPNATVGDKEYYLDRFFIYYNTREWLPYKATSTYGPLTFPYSWENGSLCNGSLVFDWFQDFNNDSTSNWVEQTSGNDKWVTQHVPEITGGWKYLRFRWTPIEWLVGTSAHTQRMFYVSDSTIRNPAELVSASLSANPADGATNGIMVPYAYSRHLGTGYYGSFLNAPYYSTPTVPSYISELYFIPSNNVHIIYDDRGTYIGTSAIFGSGSTANLSLLDEIGFLMSPAPGFGILSGTAWDVQDMFNGMKHDSWEETILFTHTTDIHTTMRFLAVVPYSYGIISWGVTETTVISLPYFDISSPYDGEVDVNLTPVISGYTRGGMGGNITTTWYVWNPYISTWLSVGTNNTPADTFISSIFTDATEYDTDYHWSVSMYDDTFPANTTTIQIFSFRTIWAVFANFIYNITGHVVTFTDHSQGMMNHWFWTFGDGDTSEERNPIHYYESDFNYTVCLTVENLTEHYTDTFCDNITMYVPPVTPAPFPAVALFDMTGFILPMIYCVIIIGLIISVIYLLFRSGGKRWKG